MEQIRARGWLNAFDVALDVLEPVGPLAAQILYTLQPLMGIFGWGGMIADLAQALDEPDGLDELRKRLNDD
ncbi:MAG: hypothetical protein H7X77_01805 [Anaerolineae bacterium]|nr:hypothetical protein [Anaerolineae bacterium]